MARQVLKHRQFRVPKKVEKDSDIVGKTSRLREITRGERKEAASKFKKMKEKNLADFTKKNRPTRASPGSNIKKRADTKNYNVGKSKGGVSFGESFRHFKKKGTKHKQLANLFYIRLLKILLMPYLSHAQVL